MEVGSYFSFASSIMSTHGAAKTVVNNMYICIWNKKTIVRVLKATFDLQVS